MKTGRIPYRDINHTMRALKQQVIDSLQFAETFPLFNSPRDLFNWMKDRTTFKNDPKRVERLQTLQTLWDSGGYGDCDCFVISLLAICWTQGPAYQDLRVILAGREKTAPVHIYNKIIYEGEEFVMDLTQPRFNSERDYKYTQELPFVIHSPQEVVFTV